MARRIIARKKGPPMQPFFVEIAGMSDSGNTWVARHANQLRRVQLGRFNDFFGA